MKKYFPLIVFIILVAAIAFVFFGGRKNIFNFSAKIESKENQETFSPQPSFNPSFPALPIGLDTPGVRAAYARYFLTGKIKEINTTDSGREIIFDTTDASLPKIVTDGQTRFWRISAPYSQETMTAAETSDIVSGMIVDISIEYDLAAKTWIVRDVYVPDDRNP